MRFEATVALRIKVPLDAEVDALEPPNDPDPDHERRARKVERQRHAAARAAEKSALEGLKLPAGWRVASAVVERIEET